MSWGVPEHGAVRLDVQDVEDLRQAYAFAELYADFVGGPVEVDLWDVQLSVNRPLIMQFLVGHPTLSRVLVHDDGAGHYAVGELPTGDGAEIRYLRPSGPFTAEPETTTITPAQARTVLADFVQTGRASVRVRWAELSMD